VIDEWVKEIKENCNPESLGMILVHNGVVRGTAKDGKPVKGMKLSYDKNMLKNCVAKLKNARVLKLLRLG